MSKVVVLNYENDHDYNLIGIHTSLEDYRLAFFLNNSLNTCLGRYHQDLDFGTNASYFSLYTFDCVQTFTYWSLISNKYDYVSDNTSLNPLFDKEYQTSLLIKEKKQVDYFLKIEGDVNEQKLEQIIYKINKIKTVITSYSINPLTLKSKDFLIF